MNIWASIRRLFASEKKLRDQPEPAAWVDEFERLRQLRAQRTTLARKTELLALPVREM